MTQAFARSIKMMVAVQAAMALATISMRHAELDKIGPYRSRGKGRGSPSRRYGNTPNITPPHQNKRECARRAKQIDAGKFDQSATVKWMRAQWMRSLNE